MLLPFDAHNHVHMGPTPLKDVNLNNCLSGMAVMSTHPRDFSNVLEMAKATISTTATILPCLGVHPWFLHELTDEDWELSSTTTSIHKDEDPTTASAVPRWIQEMEDLLLEHPQIPVGEIGLDNFHFDPTTKELTTPMATQLLALEHQLSLATKLQRPVSVHCVRAMGKILEAFQKTHAKHKSLPPRIYFHAFGGKPSTVTQLYRTLESKCPTTKCYFGFAPIINFASPKTIQVIQTVGLDRLVLETDHEDAARVPSSMASGLQVVSEALDVSPQELITRTNQNVQELYYSWKTDSI